MGWRFALYRYVLLFERVLIYIQIFENLFKKLYLDEEEIKRKNNSMYQYFIRLKKKKN